jgi:hypothetical protein
LALELLLGGLAKSLGRKQRAGTKELDPVKKHVRLETIRLPSGEGGGNTSKPPGALATAVF